MYQRTSSRNIPIFKAHHYIQHLFYHRLKMNLNLSNHNHHSALVNSLLLLFFFSVPLTSCSPKGALFQQGRALVFLFPFFFVFSILFPFLFLFLLNHFFFFIHPEELSRVSFTKVLTTTTTQWATASLCLYVLQNKQSPSLYDSNALFMFVFFFFEIGSDW